MNQNELTASEARAIVRHHVHDLRNLLNCLDLELCCLQEDPAGSAAGPQLKKMRDQLVLTERAARSLSVRFMDPAISIAAAADLFHNWRQQLTHVPQAPQIRWEESSCPAAITVDFTAVVTVLCEICLQPKFFARAQPLGAALSEAKGRVIFTIGEPEPDGSQHDPGPEAQQWLEWDRLVSISGGRLMRTHDESSALWATRLSFPPAG